MALQRKNILNNFKDVLGQYCAINQFVELAKRLKEYKFIWFGYSPLAAATKKVRDAVRTRLDNLQFPG